MANKAKITRLELVTVNGTPELRFDWDNDRHQAVRLLDTDAHAVKEALIKAVHVLADDYANGEI